MVQMAVMSGGPPSFRGWRAISAQQRTVAICLAAGVHVAVLGGFFLNSLHDPPPPPERVLEVSFISSAPANPAPPSPAQPVEQQVAPPTPQPVVRPQPTLLATPAQTSSPMTAPPVDRRASETAAPATTTAPPQPAATPSTAAPAAATTGPLTPPSFTAAYLNNPGPTYPVASRRRREQGTVRLRVQVSAEGAPIQVLLDRSSGFRELDEAAMDVVKKRWRFAPAQQAGRAVTGTVLVPLEFSITR